MSGPWLGHRDLCPIQWGKPCDCVDDGSNCICVDGSLTFECPVHGWDDSPDEPDTCHSVEVDGHAVLVRGTEMDETDRMHFAEIVRAAKRKYEADHQ